MSALSRRLRAFTLALAFAVGLGLSLAPSAGDHDEEAPLAAGALVPDALDRERLVIGASRDVEPVHLIWPAEGLRTGWWQEVRSGHLHPGVDVDGETGDPVWSAGKGTVIWAGPAPDGYSGYGTVVQIDHGQGIASMYASMYAHLSRVDVEAGQFLDAGQQIGAMGTTGNVTGSHLHFEVTVGGQRVDPETWLPPRVHRRATDVPPPAARVRFL
jgi:murein DD-endopeptidase MepM/ murein hydrolase activator NlpD